MIQMFHIEKIILDIRNKIYGIDRPTTTYLEQRLGVLGM